MRKTYTHFEQVPVAVAEQILEQQNSSAERDGNDNLTVKKVAKKQRGPHMPSKKLQVTGL